MPGRKPKVTGYSALTGVRHLAFVMGEFDRMGDDGRMPREDADLVVDTIWEAIDLVHRQWQTYRKSIGKYSPTRERDHDLHEWTKWAVTGQVKEPYRTRYLERAGLNGD